MPRLWPSNERMMSRSFSTRALPSAGRLLRRYAQGPDRRFLAPRDLLRADRVLAGMRLFLAVGGLAAVHLDPVPEWYAPLAGSLLTVYVVVSIFLVAVLRARRSHSRPLALAVHALDLTFASVLMLVTEGPASPFFVYFVFTLLAAAYRWTALASVGTAAVGVFLLAGHAGIVAMGLIDAELHLVRVVVRSAHLVTLAVVVGYLSNQEKEAHAEAWTINHLAGLAEGAPGFYRTLDGVGRELVRLFQAARLLVVIGEEPSGRVLLWECSPEAQPQARRRFVELEPEQGRHFLCDAPAAEWLWAGRPADGPDPPAWALDPSAPGLRQVRMAAPRALQACYGCGTVLGGSAVLGDLHVRVLLLDPRGARGRERSLQLLRSVLRHVGPRLHNTYLLRRYGETAGERERARVARELHDGSIQALIGIGMHLDAVSGAEGLPAGIAERVERVKGLLHSEVQGLRELMQQLRPVDIQSDQLPGCLEEVVDRFSRETGIASRFRAGGETGHVPRQLCVEIVRIVQEALANVRKHSRARAVTIACDASPAHWLLTVEDDGVGFGFTGRIEDVQRDRRQRTPAVVRERVQAVGGRLSIESAPGKARLEITIPRRTYG
jgi:signal transduction histidine kinase